jgi:hypothetical protein
MIFQISSNSCLLISDGSNYKVERGLTRSSVEGGINPKNQSWDFPDSYMDLFLIVSIESATRTAA